MADHSGPLPEEEIDKWVQENHALLLMARGATAQFATAMQLIPAPLRFGLVGAAIGPLLATSHCTACAATDLSLIVRAAQQVAHEIQESLDRQRALAVDAQRAAAEGPGGTRLH